MAHRNGGPHRNPAVVHDAPPATALLMMMLPLPLPLLLLPLRPAAVSPARRAGPGTDVRSPSARRLHAVSFPHARRREDYTLDDTPAPAVRFRADPPRETRRRRRFSPPHLFFRGFRFFLFSRPVARVRTGYVLLRRDTWNDDRRRAGVTERNRNARPFHSPPSHPWRGRARHSGERCTARTTSGAPRGVGGSDETRSKKKKIKTDTHDENRHRTRLRLVGRDP